MIPLQFWEETTRSVHVDSDSGPPLASTGAIIQRKLHLNVQVNDMTNGPSCFIIIQHFFWLVNIIGTLSYMFFLYFLPGDA